MNSRKEKPQKSIPIEKRYLYEKIGLGIAALFLDVASLSILIIAFMFILEKEKDVFTYTAMGIMGFLGFICMYFGLLLTKILIVKFKSFEIYQKYLLKEEFNGFQEN
jgi:hypothetical protein